MRKGTKLFDTCHNEKCEVIEKIKNGVLIKYEDGNEYWVEDFQLYLYFKKI